MGFDFILLNIKIKLKMWDVFGLEFNIFKAILIKLTKKFFVLCYNLSQTWNY